MKRYIKYIIFFIIFIILITIKNITNNTIINIVLNILNTNIKVKGIKNLKYYNTNKILIMSNHYIGVDFPIISHTINYYTKKSKSIYTIVKYNIFGDKEDGSYISNILGLFNNDLCKFFNFLPYVRNNKKSGEEIKNKMIDIVNNNNTVLLFPEGTGTKNGIPLEFKSGSFRLCAENNIYILPITLKFNKNIGITPFDKIDIKDWFDLKVKIIIHKPIYHNDWKVLKDKVFNKIREPFF